jgi:hypothetical protein
MRKAKKTIRRYPPTARKLAEIANDLDRQSRTLHLMAQTIAGWDSEVQANKERRARLHGCAILGKDPRNAGHRQWEPDCSGCYYVWATTPNTRRQAVGLPPVPPLEDGLLAAEPGTEVPHGQA